MPSTSSHHMPEMPPAIERLAELADNLWFGWNDSAQELFASIDRPLWEQCGRNPVKLLQETGADKLRQLAADPAFLLPYQETLRQWDAYRQAAVWFDRAYPEHRQQAVAYFSAEFGFHESLPIYSGGLGVLAGDHCKSASDLGVPLVGIGLLYKKGYFRQKLNAAGGQIAEQVSYDFASLPIQPMYTDLQEARPADESTSDGEPPSSGDNELFVQVALAERTVRLKIWQAQIGRIRVYLLDADLEDNSSWDRALTAQLYGGNQDVRIAQEVLLGMGGVKALRALGIDAGIFHINEGHAAFLSLERIRELLDDGVPFDTALEVVRASTVFTTHTPVPAGHDAFPLPSLEYYLRPLLNEYADYRQAFIDLGLDQSRKLFNMTYLALNTSALRNGVSKLHGEVSRRMFKAFHGNIPEELVPIGHITNGVHMETWLAPELKALFSQFFPEGWLSRQTSQAVWQALDTVPPDKLWTAHMKLKQKLIEAARDNLAEQYRRNGMSDEAIAQVSQFLSADALTIGFARRFATYKRAALIFRDPERLGRIINDPRRPVQLIFAGKAHPADEPGQQLIREIQHFSRQEPFRGKVVVLENYDMGLAHLLVHGADVWLNNPLRPYEASGTSGQKAAMNGVLNFSVLDGWWEEGYDGNNGWSITANEAHSMEQQEQENIQSLYHVLENEIVPLYYNRQDRWPLQWIKRMKHSIASLAPAFNTDRMVMDYTNDAYIPALRRTVRLTADNYEEAARLARFKQFMRKHWSQVRVIEVNDGGEDPDTGVSEPLKEVTATIRLGPVWYKDVAAEIVYYEQRTDGWHPVHVRMEPYRTFENGAAAFRALIPKHLRHGPHFSLRIYPVSESFAKPFELPLLTEF